MYKIFLKSNRYGTSIFEANSAARSVFVSVKFGEDDVAYVRVGEKLHEFDGVEAQFDTSCIGAESAESAANQALREYDDLLAKIDAELMSHEFKLQLHEELRKIFSEFCDNIFCDGTISIFEMYVCSLNLIKERTGMEESHYSFDEMLTREQKKKLRQLALQAAADIYEDAIS